MRFQILPPSEMKSLYGSTTRSAASRWSYVAFTMALSPTIRCRRQRHHEQSPNQVDEPRSAQRSECGSQFGAEELRLFPGREVTAFVDLVEVDQVAIGAPGPCLRSLIALPWENSNGDRKRDLGSHLRARKNRTASGILPVQP